MKNIYNEKTGYQRVSDAVAEQKVKTGAFRYASKKEAKERTERAEEAKK